MQNENRLFNIPFTTYATVTGLLTTILGLLIIIAWQHDIAFLKTFGLGETAITANLGACFLLSGLSLILLQFSRPATRILARVISITIIVIALLTILEIVFSVNFGIDEIFFRNFFPSDTIFGKTRMALTSAISSVLTAFILFFLSLKNIRLTFFIIFCFVLILSINIVGFIVLKFHLDDISKVTGYTNMSIIATLLFLNMFLGLFFTLFSKVPFKILIDQTFFAGLVFIIYFILLITQLSNSERRSVRESNEKEDNTQIVKNYLNHLVDDVLDIETGVRGYLIINNGDYLTPIKTTRADLPVSIHELSNLFQGNLMQKARIDTLNQLIMYEIVHAELIVSVIKSEGENAGKSLFQKGKGKILTDSIRAFVNKIKAEENQNLKIMNYKENLVSIASQKITVINVIIQLTLLIVIFYFFRRNINQRRNRIKEVQMLNEELENKVAERTATLTQSEEKYRRIFENVQDLYYETSIEGTILEVSPSIEILSNGQYHQDDLLGKSIYNFYSDTNERAAFLSQIKERGTVFDFEIALKNKDGSQVPCSLSSKICLDEQGNPEKIIGSMRNISDRKQAEREIIKHREHLEELVKERTEALHSAMNETRDLYENAPCGYHSLDRNGIVVRMNTTELNWLGYNKDEVINRLNIGSLFTPKSLNVFKSNFPVFVKEGKISNLEFELIRKDGSTFFVFVNATAIYDDEGNYLASRSTLFDISERKQNEEELKQTTTRLKLAVHAGGVGVWDYDIVNNILKWDDQMYELYGLNEKNFSGAYEAWQNGLHPDDRVQGDLEIQMAITGEKEFDTEFRVVWPDGTIRNMKALALVQRDDDGNALHMIGTNWDITAIRQTEAEIINARNEAENANKAKSEFLANMSHEIRTPMNAVLGYTELLGNTLVDNIQKDYINSIKSSGRSLLTLINDILDLSKIEAGKLELEYDYIDTYSFFSEFEKIFSLKVSEKGLKFILDIASGTPHGIYIDESRVRQIVFNLIGNAIKFTSEGQITLKIFIENPHVVHYSKEKSEELIDLIIEVKDTGIGISKELREAIFEPFVQERDYKHYGGTGLGLAITRRLTLLMDGTINLQSKLGEGSTFSVRIPEIPYQRDFSGTNIDIQIDPSEIIFEEAVILIADDVEHNRSYLKDALKSTSLKIFEAEDGIAALEVAKEIIPDLIIADIRMPKMDGFQLLKKIKADLKINHIPVIAYSASVLKAQKERIHKSEFAGLLIKPVKVSELYLELMNFLPFRSTRAAEPERPISEADLIAEINDLPALINILDTSLYAKWKTFAVTQPIGGIRDFGRNLVQLGTDHNSGIIKDYGRELIIAADSYNIDAMLKLIGKYPGIIENLKDSSKNKNND